MGQQCPKAFSAFRRYAGFGQFYSKRAPSMLGFICSCEMTHPTFQFLKFYSSQPQRNQQCCNYRKCFKSRRFWCGWRSRCKCKSVQLSNHRNRESRISTAFTIVTPEAKTVVNRDIREVFLRVKIAVASIAFAIVAAVIVTVSKHPV